MIEKIGVQAANAFDVVKVWEILCLHKISGVGKCHQNHYRISYTRA